MEEEEEEGDEALGEGSMPLHWPGSSIETVLKSLASGSRFIKRTCRMKILSKKSIATKLSSEAMREEERGRVARSK